VFQVFIDEAPETMTFEEWLQDEAEAGSPLAEQIKQKNELGFLDFNRLILADPNVRDWLQ
jgi:hypothetical protein